MRWPRVQTKTRPASKRRVHTTVTTPPCRPAKPVSASTASTGFASWSAVGPPAARERTTRSTATSGVSSWTDRSLGDGHLESVGVAAEAHAGKALVESRGAGPAPR